jgi:F-type H+-transporting ATPase subunit b
MNWISAAGEQQNVLLPPLFEIVIGLIAFSVVFFVLSKIALPKVKVALEERTATIEGGIERAEKMQAEASKTLGEYREQLAQARQEAARIRSEAEGERTSVIATAKQEAQVAAQQVSQQANAQIEAEKGKAVSQLRKEVGEMALDLASKVVGASLRDDARAKAVIDQFISDLEKAK